MHNDSIYDSIFRVHKIIKVNTEIKTKLRYLDNKSNAFNFTHYNIYVVLQAGMFLSLKDILQIAKADNNNKRKFLCFYTELSTTLC